MLVKSVGPAMSIAASALLLTSCSSVATPATTDTTAEVVEVAAPSDEDLASYFAAIASGDPVEMRQAAEELAAPGSNAYAYAIEQAEVGQAYLDAGWPSDSPREIETIEGGFSICPPVPSEDDPCSEYTNLTHQDGLLADFDAGGTPLAGRITLGSGQTIPLGDSGTVEFFAAYRSIAGAVFVVVEVKSNIDGLSVSYGSSYQAPDGRQSNSTDLIGPTELRAGSLANYAFVFDGAEFGGVLRLVAYNASYDEISAEIPTS